MGSRVTQATGFVSARSSKVGVPMGEPDDEEESSEPEDDERIMKLLTYTGKHTPEETAAYLEELGGDDALIYGDLWVGKPLHAKAFFLLMAAACLNDELPLAPQILEKRALFKACKGGDEAQSALLVMLELFCIKERRAGLAEFGAVLKVLWERDIVEQGVIEAWIDNERALQEVHPGHFSQTDAETVRQSSREFVEWLQAGEDEP
uniref:W2 domain-containing protein n=1 Tax=Pyrodinium bahamense TaxID=73915 RepID=A0A7S0AH68_9DINO|mmetsp:Transcript_34216/g.94528  ORF Transcript_34216/g.94528 Transcript_34216/m.94528 type:complete len:206 (+) Transcript_34216:8-625(+)